MKYTETHYPERTKLNDFFPQEMYDELRTVAEQNTPEQTSAGKRKNLLSVHHALNPDINQYVYDYFDQHVNGTYIHDHKDNMDCRGRLQGLPPQNEYKIHQDFYQKVITLLIYISPQDADGTVFYKDAQGITQWGFGVPYAEEGTQIVEDTWTPNSGYWFDHKQAPWHSYTNRSQTWMRWVYMWNLIDTRSLNQ